MSHWSVSEDSNFNLVFKFDGTVQAVLHNPAKPCPGTKQAKLCME
jgi:hypothetical protein